MTKRKALSDKILCLGVDGLDPRFTKRMLREGKMPNVQKFVERGAQREDLVMLGGHPTVTPPMWTTLATGCYANVHGITGYNRKSPLGLDYVGYNIDSRNCKAEQLWNVFAEAGKKTLVWHWPGSSWPPSSDSPNLSVVDGTSPGSVGMSIGQFDKEMILGANEEVQTRFIKNGGQEDTDMAAPCVITGMDGALIEEGFTIMGGISTRDDRSVIIRDREDGLAGAGDRSVMDIVQSRIKPATGWANAPEDAKEFEMLFSDGFVRNPALILKNEDGVYDRVAVYTSKKDAEPVAVLTVGKLVPSVVGKGIKNDETVDCNRNMELLELQEDGSQLRMYISAAMLNDVSACFHPKELFDTVTKNVGLVPPTSMLGNQDKELINHIMLDNWQHTAEWQADALNYLIDNEGYEIIFSHFHNIDLEEHMFIRYLSDKGYNKLDPQEYVKMQEDVYVQTDYYLGRFLHYLDEGWTVLIFSDHGLISSAHDMVELGDDMGVNCGIMEELGLMTLKRDENGNRMKEIDWEHTVAVAQREQHIYINLKGRDPHGIVDPKDKYEVEEEVMTRLYGYRDKKTGKRVVAVALRNKDAVLLGQGGPEAGDICYWLTEGYNFDHADCLSTTYGDEETSVSPIFIAAGKGLKSGFTTDRIIRQIDFVPTIAILGGVRMPAQCEGAPIYPIFEEEF